jgi:hypothetical protein
VQTRAQCDPLMTAVNLASVRLRLGVAAALYPIQSHDVCFTLGGGFDAACVQAAVNKAYATVINGGGSVPAALTAARNRYLAAMRCGLTGIASDLTCVDLNANADAARVAVEADAAAEIAYTTYKPSTSNSAASGGGGGLPLAAVAGAAGGVVVLVVIVVLVVLRRRKEPGSNNRVSKLDRVVVAFANPMYNGQTTAGPTGYSNTDELYHAEGLYDDVAFGPAAKSAKPIYLDTAPNDPDRDYMDTNGYIKSQGKADYLTTYMGVGGGVGLSGKRLSLSRKNSTSVIDDAAYFTTDGAEPAYATAPSFVSPPQGNNSVTDDNLDDNNVYMSTETVFPSRTTRTTPMNDPLPPPPGVDNDDDLAGGFGFVGLDDAEDTYFAVDPAVENNYFAVAEERFGGFHGEDVYFAVKE